ncbi:hypothetical protein NLG97_g10271 [Lecanicillium saksenae]|uniref:Uncharacterized protein n=1 Tax=Lecanicillium saksenae TaxID=468837 RepID=A0ACC1QHL3_9HYPO|nr:hypothetical protein NLG97_g10271 [Lecanicillium saksenae]
MRLTNISFWLLPATALAATPTSTDEPSACVAARAPIQTYHKCKILHSTVNCRSGPSLSARVVKSLTVGNTYKFGCYKRGDCYQDNCTWDYAIDHDCYVNGYYTSSLCSTKKALPIMLIQESHVDVKTTANGKESTMRIFVFHPVIPGFPNAYGHLIELKACNRANSAASRFPGVCLFSEIYQVTGPVARFARQIAGHGYIVAAPSSYHDFTGPEPLKYDAADTDKGNQYKIQKVHQDERLSFFELLLMYNSITDS